MPDIASWLQSLGLRKYAEAFERNEIDFDTLPLLTLEMIEEIGLPIGPIAKLLAAIAELAASASAVPAADPTNRSAKEFSAAPAEAELLRLRGDVLLAATVPARRRRQRPYRRAIAAAQRQRARSLELRAATSLAQHLFTQGRTAEAREALARIYSWFTEGFDTAT
jgi:SAM domain (Sterile alpha motif)